MSEHRHDFVYHGALDIFENKELLAVIESWRCRTCNMLRLGQRGPDVLSSMEGMQPDLADSSDKWVLLVCMAGEKASWNLSGGRPGASITHQCPSNVEGHEFILQEDYTIRTTEWLLPGRHFSYLYANIVKGYIELRTRPPTVVTLSGKK